MVSKVFRRLIEDMKKLNLILLSFALLLAAFGGLVGVDAAISPVEIAGAEFGIDEVLASDDLAYGIKHTLAKSYTKTSVSGYDADGLGTGTDTVQAGVSYAQQVNVLEVPTTTEIKITNWANFNGNRWTLTTVKGLIGDYEGKHPGWKVIAAINGDFFDIGGKGNLPYQTGGAVASDGENFKTTAGDTVAFTNDGTINSLVGNQPVERTANMVLAVYDATGAIVSEFSIDTVNAAPGANQTALYYANYDSTHTLIPVEVSVPTEASGYFVDSASRTLPNSPTDFYGKGEITSLESKTIASGQFAIVTNNAEVKAALAVGVTIRAQYEFLGAYANINNIAGCGQTIMSNGVVAEAGLTDRAPRTVVGRKADGTIVMMVVDGRQASKGMYGCDRTELAAIMTSFGAVDAYNLDGGGSSTMVIRQSGSFVVQNSPSDGRERTDANCLLIVAKDPELTISVSEFGETDLDFSVNLANSNGHDIVELFMEMNGETKPVVNNSVNFANLSHNTEYLYHFYYENSLGEMKMIIQDGKAKSLKLTPEYLGLEIYETPDSFRIKLLYTDLDKAGTYAGANLGINGRTTFFKNGEITLKKSIIGYEITQLSLSFSYDLNDGNRQITNLVSPNYTYFIDLTVYFNNILVVQKSAVQNIYK